MFLIDKEKNEAISISRKTFQELEFKERKHLQEWICKNTDILGKDCLLYKKSLVALMIQRKDWIFWQSMKMGILLSSKIS